MPRAAAEHIEEAGLVGRECERDPQPRHPWEQSGGLGVGDLGVRRIGDRRLRLGSNLEGLTRRQRPARAGRHGILGRIRARPVSDRLMSGASLHRAQARAIRPLNPLRNPHGAGCRPEPASAAKGTFPNAGCALRRLSEGDRVRNGRLGDMSGTSRGAVQCPCNGGAFS